MDSNTAGEAGVTFRGDLNATFSRPNLWSHWIITFRWPRREGSVDRYRAHFDRPACQGFVWYPIGDGPDEPVVSEP